MLADVITWLGSHKDALEALQSAFTVLGILAAGTWTYQLFVAKRQKYPRAVIDQRVLSWPLTDDKVLLRVTVVIRNQGEVLLKLQKGFTWMQQLHPLDEEIAQRLQGGQDIVITGEAEARWPLLGERVHFTERKVREIEPGEPDELNTDFVLDSTVKRVLVYTHLENSQRSWWSRLRSRRKIGWSSSLVYEIATQHQINEQETVMSGEKQKPRQGGSKPGTRQGEAKPRPASVPNRPLPTSQGEAKPKPQPPKK